MEIPRPRRILASFRDFSVKKTAIPVCVSRDGDADPPKARSDRVGHGAPVFNAINAIVADNAGGPLYSRSLRPQSRPHADVQPLTLLRSVAGETLRDSPQDPFDLAAGSIDYLLLVETRERLLFGSLFGSGESHRARDCPHCPLEINPLRSIDTIAFISGRPGGGGGGGGGGQRDDARSDMCEYVRVISKRNGKRPI